MSIIRWVLSNMLLVFAAALLVVGAIYWDEVRPELMKIARDAGIVSDEVAAAPAAKAAKTKSPAQVAKTETPAPAAKTAPPAPAAKTEAPAPAAMAPAPAPLAPVTSAPAAPTPATSAPAAPGAVVTEAPAQAAPAPYGRPAPIDREEMERRMQQRREAMQQQRDAMRQQMQARMEQQRQRMASARPTLSDTLKKDWAAAREAYWKRDMDKAVALYAALAEAHPDQADVQGELGNVYLALGKREQAADAYQAAGEALLKAGRTMEAGKALMPLGRLAPEKAEALRKKIAALTSAPK